MIGTTNAIQVIPRYNMVTNGLLMYLDGIQNNRSGHNGNSTSWEDLSGNNIDWVLGSNHSFGTNYLACNGGVTLPANGVNKTLISSGSYYNSYTYQCILATQNSGNWCVFDFSYHTFSFYSSYYIFGAGIGSVPVCPIGSRRTGFYSLSVCYLPTGCEVYYNNTRINMGSSTDYWSGAGYAIGKLAASESAPYYGKIYAIRVYNRALTEAERNMNWDYDRTRFNIAT